MNRLQKLIVYAAASNNLYDYISKRLEEITGKPVSNIEQEYLSMTQVSQKLPAAVPASVPKATSYTSAPTKPVKPTAKPVEQTIQTKEDKLKEEKIDTSKKEVKETSDAKENKSEPNKDFQEQYVKAKSVQERQRLILQYAQKPKQLHGLMNS